MPIGSFALGARLTLARMAEKSLDLQYYLIAHDATGRYLLHTLRDAALRGVRVRLLLGDLCTFGEDPLPLGFADYPNIEVRLFNPFPAARFGFPRSARKNTEMGVIIESPQLSKEVVRLLNIAALQSAYRLRISQSDGQLEWLATETDKEAIMHEEPASTFWMRFELKLLRPLAPEELL